MKPSRLHGGMSIVSLAVCWHFQLAGPWWLFAGMWLAWFFDSWNAARSGELDRAGKLKRK